MLTGKGKPCRAPMGKKRTIVQSDSFPASNGGKLKGAREKRQ